jgi:ribosome-interacting GTPase 1
MLAVEDVAIQVVDQPSISPEHPIPWIGNALQTAHAAAYVVDVSRPGCVERMVQVVEILAERQIVLTERWPVDGPVATDEDAVPDPFTTVLPTVLVANKADLVDHVGEELAVLEELAGVAFPSLTTSAVTGEGLDAVGPWLFERLGIIRVYTKIPGAAADMGRPFTVRAGQTVGDVAMLVHRDIAGSLRYARIWGKGWFDGQQVGRDHPVRDGDVVELHA